MCNGTAPGAAEKAEDVMVAALVLIRSHPSTAALAAAVVAERRPFQRLLAAASSARDLAEWLYYADCLHGVVRPLTRQRDATDRQPHFRTARPWPGTIWKWAIKS